METVMQQSADEDARPQAQQLDTSSQKPLTRTEFEHRRRCKRVQGDLEWVREHHAARGFGLNSHLQHGVWVFEPEHDKIAKAKGFESPEDMLEWQHADNEAILDVGDAPKQCLLRWKPYNENSVIGDCTKAQLAMSAKDHLEAILQAREIAGLSLLAFMTYPQAEEISHPHDSFGWPLAKTQEGAHTQMPIPSTPTNPHASQVQNLHDTTLGPTTPGTRFAVQTAPAANNTGRGALSTNDTSVKKNIPKAVRACKLCNSRRARCDRGRPCSRCVKLNHECEYPSPEDIKKTPRKVATKKRPTLLVTNDGVSVSGQEVLGNSGDVHQQNAMPFTQADCNVFGEPPLENRDVVHSGGMILEANADINFGQRYSEIRDSAQPQSLIPTPQTSHTFYGQQSLGNLAAPQFETMTPIPNVQPQASAYGYGQQAFNQYAAVHPQSMMPAPVSGYVYGQQSFNQYAPALSQNMMPAPVSGHFYGYQDLNTQATAQFQSVVPATQAAGPVYGQSAFNNQAGTHNQSMMPIAQVPTYVQDQQAFDNRGAGLQQTMLPPLQPAGQAFSQQPQYNQGTFHLW